MLAIIFKTDSRHINILTYIPQRMKWFIDKNNTFLKSAPATKKMSISEIEFAFSYNKVDDKWQILARGGHDLDSTLKVSFAFYPPKDSFNHFLSRKFR